MKTVMLVFGTRPEAIKMCPVLKEFEKRNFQCDEQELRDLWDVAREFEDESFEKYEVLKACKRVYEKCRGKGKGD